VSKILLVLLLFAISTEAQSEALRSGPGVSFASGSLRSSLALNQTALALLWSDFDDVFGGGCLRRFKSDFWGRRIFARSPYRPDLSCQLKMLSFCRLGSGACESRSASHLLLQVQEPKSAGTLESRRVPLSGFENTQMNLNAGVLIDGISPEFEYQKTQGTEFATDAFSVGVAVPDTATVHQANGLGGYVTGASPVTAAVGVYAQSRAVANNAQVWGMNSVVQVDKGITGAKLTSFEVDVNQNSGVDAVFGQAVGQDGINVISFGSNKPRYGLIVVAPIPHSYWQMAAQFSNFQKLGVQISTGALGSTALKIIPPDDSVETEVSGRNASDNGDAWRIRNDGGANFSNVTIGEGTPIVRYARYTALESPSQIRPNTCSAQTFTNIRGILAGDVLIAVNKPTDETGLMVSVGHVIGANSATVNFCNVTNYPIKPAGREAYQFVVMQ
jgi:hypothetical protein